MNLILLGAPGSGKGTQSEFLIEKRGFIQFSTGDLFRMNISNNTELGIEAKKYMNEGKLVPDAITNAMVEKYLEDHNDNLIFDGYPRTIEQAVALDDMLKKYNKKIDLVINIFVPEELLIERLTGRLVCPKCKRSFHLINRRPKVEGTCDYDGEKLITREDDKPNKIAIRLEAFKNETAPLIEFYKDKEKQVEVHGHDVEPIEVFKRIEKELN